MGAACFHRDSPDALAASSGSRLQQPGWWKVSMSLTILCMYCMCMEHLDVMSRMCMLCYSGNKPHAHMHSVLLWFLLYM